MLNTIFATSVATTLTFTSTLIVILSALLLGLFISLIYIKTHNKEGYAGSFTITLIMLPVIIAVIILLVGNNVARAFSLAGAFSLIRFRSAPGDPKDISYVFFTLAVGLACGMGYIAYAVLFAIILCLVMVILTIIKYGASKSPQMQLKITVPEDLDYQNLFDEVFEIYLIRVTLTRVKTADFGSLFELVYSINIKANVNQKEFIDKLRCKNSNLNIVLTLREIDDRVYN